MEIKLSLANFEILNENILKKIFSNLEIEIKNNEVIILGDYELFEELLDVISDLFIEKGIDDYGETNPFGYKIEKIIDLISDQVYD